MELRALRVCWFGEMLVEELGHRRVELLVERNAVEARRLLTEFGPSLEGRAKSQMAGIRNHVIFVFGWKVCVQGGDIVEQHAEPAPFRGPELNRRLDRRQALRGE